MPGPDELIDKSSPCPSKAAAGEIMWTRPSQRQEHVEQVRTGETLAIALDERAQLGSALSHFEREHGSPCNLEREALHGRKEIHRRSSGGAEFSGALLRG